MAKKYRLNDVAQLNGRNIFFDANVLIYLFWPTGQHYFEKNYASVFSNLLKQGNNLFVDFLVISEVVNRILKTEHQKTNPTQKFKDFRDSQNGKNALKDIHIIVKNNILDRFNVVGKAFDKQDIKCFLAVDELDFVDKAIVSTCSENKLVLLTNDKDFKNCTLDIITDNQHIFN